MADMQGLRRFGRAVSARRAAAGGWGQPAVSHTSDMATILAVTPAHARLAPQHEMQAVKHDDAGEVRRHSVAVMRWADCIDIDGDEVETSKPFKQGKPLARTGAAP